MPGVEKIVATPDDTPDPSKVPEGATVDKNGTVRLSTDQTPAKSKEGEGELILGKFKNQDELIKGYQELEKRMGSGKPETPAPKKPTEPTPADKATQTIEDAGLDLDEFAREIFEKGELSEKSKMALVAKGIKKETVDNYVAGQKALGEQITTEVQNIVGGAESYKALTEWAKANLDEADQSAFDEAIFSGNTALAKLAVQGLAARYNDSVGTDGELVTGSQSANTSGVKPFASQQEIIRAMADPRYKSGDTAYIAEVQKRMSKTKVLG